MDAKAHWEGVYARKQPTEVSWYQPRPTRSLELLQRCGLTARSTLIDVGGGDSTLVDALLELGLRSITVLDISAAALARARARLGERAAAITWTEADVTRVELPPRAFDFWHDRAVFHVLGDPADRRRYVERATASVRPGGSLVIATFAPDGPTRCSGLDVTRYGPEDLAREFGEDAFELIDDCAETHRTPSGAEQRFTYSVLRRRGPS